MKIISVFVASSIKEFSRERLFLGEFIRRSNNGSFKQQGFQVRLFMCEDELINSQPTYDRYIHRCNVFIAIVGKRLGKYTAHEIDIASDDESILKKYILSFNQLDNNNYYSFERIISSSDSLIHDIQNLIESVSCEILPHVIDSINQSTSNCYYLGMPMPTDSLEYAAIGNIIRRYEDQEYSIHVIDNSCDNECNSHVVLLSGEVDSEIPRIEHFLSLKGINDSLWVYIGEDISNEIAALVVEVEKVGNYPDSFSTPEELSMRFENRLLRALLRNNPGRFHYYFEDHVLIREFVLSKNRIMVKNILDGEFDWCNNENYLATKERIIVGILNLYNSTNLFDKHQEAISALETSNYEYFRLDAKALLDLPAGTFKDNIRDSLIDSIVNIYKALDTLTVEQVRDSVERIIGLLYDERITSLLTPEDNFLFYSACGQILSYNDDLYPKAIEYLLRAESFYLSIPKSSNSISEHIKQVVISLIRIYLDHDRNALDNIINKYMSFDNDDVFFAQLLVYKALSCDSKRDAKLLFNEAEKHIQKHIHEDNAKLNLYLQIRCTNLLSDALSSDSWKLFVENKIGPISQNASRLYSAYLKNLHYPVTGAWILILQSVINNDLNGCEQAIRELKENCHNWQWDLISPDVLYCKAKILEDLREFEKANVILEALYNSATNNEERALYKQNMALNYMALYFQPEMLGQAERCYNEALLLFKQEGKIEHEGNVLDGLAYCLILQKKYANAEKYASMALQNSDYVSANKHSNYISSLLCQRKYIKALYHFYIRCHGDEQIKRIMSDDWNNDMKNVGIDTSSFIRLFGLENSL